MHYEQSRKQFVDELHALMVRHSVSLETVTDGYGDDRIAFAGPPGKPRWFLELDDFGPAMGVPVDTETSET